jgi:acyl carrier protein
MTTPSPDAVLFEILGRIAPEADPHTLSLDEDVREALDIDSFDFLNFIIALNEELGVDIPESDYGQLRTLRNLHDYLAAHVA